MIGFDKFRYCMPGHHVLAREWRLFFKSRSYQYVDFCVISYVLFTSCYMRRLRGIFRVSIQPSLIYSKLRLLPFAAHLLVHGVKQLV